jgi:hypothetical protein
VNAAPPIVAARCATRWVMNPSAPN